MYSAIKRAVDVLVAATAIILLSPLLVPIAIVLRLTGEGWVFYKQKRIGYKNRPFYMYKFATMLKDSPNMGTGSITLRNDPRVTPAGRFLRKTKINELPQLYNLLRGDMTLVGPRPFMDETFEAYPKEVQRQVYNVRPGLTGIGSVMFRDEERLISDAAAPPKEFYRDVISPYKGALELWYQRNVGLATDVKLLLATFLVLFLPSAKIVYFLFPNVPRPASELFAEYAGRRGSEPRSGPHFREAVHHGATGQPASRHGSVRPVAATSKSSEKSDV